MRPAGSLHPVRHATVSLDGAPFHVAEAGEAGAELAILLHGFPECWYSWRPVMQALAPDFHVVAPDNRGFNLSDKTAPTSAYTPEALCGDVLALLRHYGAERCVLVGHDWGGVLAWYFAARHPECVTRLVILNAPHPNRLQWALDHDPAQRAASQYMARLRDPGCEEGLGADGEALWAITLAGHERYGLVDALDKEVYMQGWRTPGALTAMLNWYRAAPFVVPGADDGYDEDRQQLVGEVRVRAPTLLIWGMRDDILLPVLLDGLEAYVPNLEICRFEDAGHGLLHEKPSPTAQAVREFLLRTGGQ
ncbi:alpha/beta fold hydrolase [Massilia glaciei]|nr:alpha/beta hydrolase [Massilia glaciei]